MSYIFQYIHVTYHSFSFVIEMEHEANIELHSSIHDKVIPDTQTLLSHTTQAIDERAPNIFHKIRIVSHALQQFQSALSNALSTAPADFQAPVTTEQVQQWRNRLDARLSLWITRQKHLSRNMAHVQSHFDEIRGEIKRYHDEWIVIITVILCCTVLPVIAIFGGLLCAKSQDKYRFTSFFRISDILNVILYLIIGIACASLCGIVMVYQDGCNYVVAEPDYQNVIRLVKLTDWKPSTVRIIEKCLVDRSVNITSTLQMHQFNPMQRLRAYENIARELYRHPRLILMPEIRDLVGRFRDLKRATADAWDTVQENQDCSFVQDDYERLRYDVCEETLPIFAGFTLIGFIMVLLLLGLCLVSGCARGMISKELQAVTTLETERMEVDSDSETEEQGVNEVTGLTEDEAGKLVFSQLKSTDCVLTTPCIDGLNENCESNHEHKM